MNSEARLITAICKHKDMASALSGSDIDELFESYADVWEEMKKHYYKYKSCPDVKLVKEWFNDFEAAEVEAPVKYYIENLREERLENGLERIMRGVAKEMDAKTPPKKILDKLGSFVSNLNKFSSESRDVDVTNSTNSLKHYEQIKERVAQMGGAVGIQTQFDSIDSAYSTGMAPGHFICVIGWPGNKKTFFAGRLAINVWRQGFKPMIVSLEMSPENMRDRIYTMMGEGQWRMSAFNKASFNLDEFKDWAEINLEDKPTFPIVSSFGTSEVTPAFVQSKIDQYKPDWILIDYLQLMTDNNRSGSDAARVMNISRELKRLAVSNNIPVVAVISATSQDKEDRKSPPTLAQAAWSKSIEYDADMALAVHTYDNQQTGESITEIAKRKNRHGDDFNFFINLNPETGVLEEKWDSPDWLGDNA